MANTGSPNFKLFKNFATQYSNELFYSHSGARSYLPHRQFYCILLVDEWPKMTVSFSLLLHRSITTWFFILDTIKHEGYNTSRPIMKDVKRSAWLGFQKNLCWKELKDQMQWLGRICVTGLLYRKDAIEYQHSLSWILITLTATQLV